MCTGAIQIMTLLHGVAIWQKNIFLSFFHNKQYKMRCFLFNCVNGSVILNFHIFYDIT